ncbi:fimbria/pilus periplasmic chaperone [Vibrio sp. S4M6]|uniref:fimbria/pilus periplasmic chaperone n=1 Tax=Vibrio sinus TaxID=2946865 RepID=UPI00202A0FF9|nr:fimbria/pilus periplasmic chaperone [Vibrio sinus]MCL9781615.1 fimbria/pilus periplasmic chaperone [Vibrio sinus]
MLSKINNRSTFSFKCFMLITVLLSYSSSSFAYLTLSKTRLVVPANEMNAEIVLSNPSDRTFGYQASVLDGNFSVSDQFAVIPQLGQLDSKQKQELRVMNAVDTTKFPTDRESLFYLSIQEIPMLPENAPKSSMMVAINDVIKLLYRPESISKHRKNAEKSQLQWTTHGRKMVIENRSPYYFAILNVNINGKPVALPKGISPRIAKFQPFSKVSFKQVVHKGDKVSVSYLDDYGIKQTTDVSFLQAPLKAK